MNMLFSGVTEVRGSSRSVQTYVHQQSNLVGTVYATVDSGFAVVMDGKDSADFLKQEYGIEFPAELFGRPSEEMQAAIDRDPDKYLSLLGRVLNMLSYGPKHVEQKVLRSYEAKKAVGADADGNPIQELNV